MKWFRLYTEIKDDPKMLELDDHQFRVWINLLSMAGESEERGVIPAARPRGLAAALHTAPEDMETAFLLFTELGMVERREDGSLLIVNFMERQYDNPSDHPEKVAERKTRMKERQQNAPAPSKNAAANHRNETGTTKEREQNAEERLYSEDTQTIHRGEDTECQKTDTPPPAAVRVRASPNDFNLFWDAYPKKESKKDAWEAWKRLNPSQEILAAILAGIGRAKTGDQWQRSIIPHPATWLNGKRWEDEINTAALVSARASPTRNGVDTSPEARRAQTLEAIRGMRP